jgi:hypothetical protein
MSNETLAEIMSQSLTLLEAVFRDVTDAITLLPTSHHITSQHNTIDTTPDSLHTISF